MLSILFVASLLAVAFAASKDKPHGHQGVLEAFTGKLLPFKVTGDQEKKLANGDAVRTILHCFMSCHVIYPI